MIHMPLSILFTFCILIGWPLVKTATAMLARRFWAKLRSLEASLLRDPAYEDIEDRKIIARQIGEAHSQPLFLLMPVIVFFGGIAFAIMEILGQSNIPSDINDIKMTSTRQYAVIYGNRAVIMDERFIEIVDDTFTIAALNYPICSVLTAIAIVIVAPVILLAGGLKTSIRTVVERVLRSSAIATLAFGRGIGTPRAA
jgi:hypothetical protein